MLHVALLYATLIEVSRRCKNKGTYHLVIGKQLINTFGGWIDTTV